MVGTEGGDREQRAEGRQLGEEDRIRTSIRELRIEKIPAQTMQVPD